MARMTAAEMDAAVQAQLRARQQSEHAMHVTRSRQARCALLPSADSLADGGGFGNDAIGTKKDFDMLTAWLQEVDVACITFYDASLDRARFSGVCHAFFGTAWAAICHTAFPNIHELVFAHYGGHGVPPGHRASSRYSARPVFTSLDENYSSVVDQFALREHRPLSGGELCLHHLGFANLRSVLVPFVTAILRESQNSQGPKMNKHLVVLFDSCYSGRLAEELDDKQLQPLLEQLAQRNCTITVQAACSREESTYGGYFTPYFLRLQREPHLLATLAANWAKLPPEERDRVASLPLPSPCVRSTRTEFNANADTYPIEVQNLRLTLFPNAGFFKFCVRSLLEEREHAYFAKRQLTPLTAEAFLRGMDFRVRDAKLKDYRGRPFGLFLLADPADANCVVCAHIHFGAKTDSVGRINLVHHVWDSATNLALLEDGQKMPCGMKPHPSIGHRARVDVEADWLHWDWATESSADLAGARALVASCCTWLDSNFPTFWKDAAKWVAQGKDPSLMGHFRTQSRSPEEFDAYLQRLGEQIPTIDGLKFKTHTGDSLPC